MSPRGAADVVDLTDLPAGGAIGPDPCPACSGNGYLDHIDLARAKKTQSCLACGIRWTTAVGTSNGGALRFA